MIRQDVNITIHRLTLLPSNSNVVTNIIPAIIAMKKRRTTNPKFGKRKNGIQKRSYAVLAKKS